MAYIEDILTVGLLLVLVVAVVQVMFGVGILGKLINKKINGK